MTTSLLSRQISPYYFCGYVPETVLHRYLDKAVFVGQLSQMCCFFGAVGPTYRPDYNPSSTDLSALYDPAYDHGKLLQMVIHVRAKFLFDMTFFVTGPGETWYLDWVCKTLQNDINFLHSRDPEIICGASIAEYIDSKVNIDLPSTDVIGLFYDDPHGRLASGGFTGKYDFRRMRYASSTSSGYQGADITQPETRLYFYHLATRYIDAGCEAIHFGDAFTFLERDNNNQKFWSLLKLIRNYASTHARRGVVLMDTHCSGLPDRPTSRYGYYYDPNPSDILPNWKRQLVFDFQSQGLYARREGGCAPGDMRIIVNDDGGVLNHSLPGLNPQGWLCTHNPVLSRLDSSVNYPPLGCGTTPDSRVYMSDFYGYESNSWFIAQDLSVRKLILRYLYYKTKCVDPYAHFAMVLRTLWHDQSLPPDRREVFYINDTEKDTIRDIFSGRFAAPTNWAPHNFSIENVANNVNNVRSDLIFVGGNKMFYIATDGYIHGYIYNNGTFNGGNWLTVSPSYSAQIFYGRSAGTQIKARTSLVASPDGRRLLYIGEDGYVHGFDIIDEWRYVYIEDFMRTEMRRQDLTADCCLIYPGNDRIYYIAKQSNGSKRVHGFQKSSGTWQTVSPTYSALSTFHQSLFSQSQAEGSLTYDSFSWPHRIYFRTPTGYLAYYEVVNIVDYKYVSSPGNLSLSSQNLKIVGKLAIYRNRIYYVALQGNGEYWIHCLIDNGSTWGTVSPSHSAALFNGQPLSTQAQADPSGEIAVSPDGNTIAYFGKMSPFVQCYRNINNVTYAFNGLAPQIIARRDWSRLGTSLQFTNDKEFFFILPGMYANVRRFVYQESYCNNTSINDYSG